MQIKIIVFLMLISPSVVFGQRTQLSSIPGQDSDMDINDMLYQIMAPYHGELTNLNNRLSDEEIKLQLLNDFKTNVDNFKRVNDYIYGYESAFRSLTNDISAPNDLDVQLERIAKKGKYIVNIKQLAQKDAFTSPAISLDQQIPAGDFLVTVNNEETQVNFGGGNVLDFANILQKTLKDNVDIKVVNTSSDSRTISFSGKEEGAAYKIDFSGDLTPLLNSKILTKGDIIENPYPFANETLTLSNNSFRHEINQEIMPNTRLIFSATATKIIEPETPKEDVFSLTELDKNNIGEIFGEDFQLPGATPILSDFTEPEIAEEPKEPVQTITLHFSDQSKETLELSSQNYNISLENYTEKNLIAINFQSEELKTEITTPILTTTPDGALRPYRTITKAQDAKIEFDGVEIVRSKNSISDLLPGVTFDLLQANKMNIDVEIKPDVELVKETIVQWVLAYNTIMEEIHTFITIPINKIGRLKPLHQRLEDNEDLKEGTFFGNSSLLSYRDRLRRMIGSSYGNNPNQISLLDQIGIYVRRPNSVSSDPESIQKGTLTLDIDELEKELNSDFDAIHEIFVLDTDGDFRGDMGLTVTSTEINNMMIGGNGYLSRNEQESNRKLKDFNTRITKKEDEIDNIERRERRSLLQMSQAVAASKSQNEALRQRFGN